MSKWAIRMAKDGARKAMQVRDRARYAESKKIEEDLPICDREKVIKRRLKKQNMKMQIERMKDKLQHVENLEDTPEKVAGKKRGRRITVKTWDAQARQIEKVGNWLREDYEFGCCSVISANVVMDRLGLDNVRVPPGWVEE